MLLYCDYCGNIACPSLPLAALVRQIEQALSFLTLRKVRATPTSVQQQADASTAAAAPSGRPISTSPKASTAALLAGSTRLEPQFETDRDQSGAAIRERFSEGQIVWVFHCELSLPYASTARRTASAHRGRLLFLNPRCVRQEIAHKI